MYTCIYISHLYIEDVRYQNVHTCIYVCIQVHTCIYVCIHIHIHRCTYIPSIIATPSPSTGHFRGKSTILTGSFAKDAYVRCKRTSSAKEPLLQKNLFCKRTFFAKDPVRIFCILRMQTSQFFSTRVLPSYSVLFMQCVVTSCHAVCCNQLSDMTHSYVAWLPSYSVL